MGYKKSCYDMQKQWDVKTEIAVSMGASKPIPTQELCDQVTQSFSNTRFQFLHPIVFAYHSNCFYIP